MHLLGEYQTSLVFGGVDTITPACYDVINLRAHWWFYGVITSDTFTSTFTNYCAPDVILVIDSNQLDVIACASRVSAIEIAKVCHY